MILGTAKTLRVNLFTNCDVLSQGLSTALISKPRHILQRLKLSPGCLDQKTKFHFGSRRGTNALFKDSERKDGKDRHGPEVVQQSVTPWYLRVESSSSAQQNLSEKQGIPELPKSPPAILEPLFEEMFVNLGLDDLALLDLRHLDPPPALGASLLMIIGTARSEKHLYVSADRLCRWLRSQYKLSPSADGLLGRNELKLKMRRKNRKARLAGSESLDEFVDDGVTTGWICVNVGTVEKSNRIGVTKPKREGSIGFGRKASGVNIVIQLLTKEKREELCLENLWGGISERHSQARAESASVPENVKANVDPIRTLVQSHQDDFPANKTENGNATDIQMHFLRHPMSSQTRKFHSSTIRGSTLSSQLAETGESNGMEPIPLDQYATSNPKMLSQEVLNAIASGDYDFAKSLLEHGNPTLRNNGWKVSLLNSMRVYLESLPPIEAVKNLGFGYSDTSSTPLLTCIYKTVSAFPTGPEWEFLIWMHCFARHMGHSGYSIRGLSILHQQLELSGVTISNESYLMLLRAVASGGCKGTKKLRLIENIFRDMEHRLGNVLTEEVLITLQEVVDHPAENGDLLELPLENDSLDLPTRPTSHIRSRLDTLIWTLEVPITRDESRIRLFNAYARKGQWVSFWKLWRSIALHGMSRSPDLYACMFRRVAGTNNQRGCMKALRTWVPDMSREVPQVELKGEVREAVLSCLQVADPNPDRDAILQENAKGEWIGLWRLCLQK